MAYDINDRGDIVGQSAFDDSSFHAVRWSAGNVLDLGKLTGGRSSEATAINNLGVIVGDSGTADGDQHAVLWKEGAITDLNSFLSEANRAHLILKSANDINDQGWIVGTAVQDGRNVAYLLAPVPEPGTWALLSAGILILVARERGLRRQLA